MKPGTACEEGTSSKPCCRLAVAVAARGDEDWALCREHAVQAKRYWAEVVIWNEAEVMPSGDQDAVLACLLADDLADPTTRPDGTPCKGKRAAQVLAAIATDLNLRQAMLRFRPDLLQQSDEALAPFNLSSLLGEKSTR